MSKYDSLTLHFAGTRRGNAEADRRGRQEQNILGIFLFGTSRVGEFLERAYVYQRRQRSASRPEQAGAYVKDMEGIAQGTRRKTGRGGLLL